VKLALLVDASQTKGSITQEEIIQAAEKHLGSLGVSHFQVAPICHELNISPSIVNYHFTFGLARYFHVIILHDVHRIHTVFLNDYSLRRP
jgi:AcrR family transcriptional regulator